MRRSSVRMRRSSVGSASACCKAGPSSILGSASQGGSSRAERRSDEDTRRQASANGEGWMNMCCTVWMNGKDNNYQKNGIMPPNLRKLWASGNKTTIPRQKSLCPGIQCTHFCRLSDYTYPVYPDPVCVRIILEQMFKKLKMLKKVICCKKMISTDAEKFSWWILGFLLHIIIKTT